MTSVAIVIPYFQKSTGILRRALTSVLAQRVSADMRVDVIVVDDGSPVPAAEEIKGLDFSAPFHLTVVAQTNGGVAKARNIGLASIPENTDYAAFLDSDDIWEPEHLPRAIAALGLGFDYYFCDNARKGSHDSYFRLIEFDPPSTRIGTELGIQELFEIDKATLFDMCLRTCASLTSTIVYRRSMARDMSFNTWLHPAGEDNLFFLQLIQRAQRTCYSRQVLVTYADGVGIWYSRYSWDAPTHAISQLCRVLSAQEMKKTVPMSASNVDYITQEITRLRRFFAYLSIRKFLKTRQLWSPETARLTRCDPAFRIWFPMSVLYVAAGLALRFYTPPRE